LMSYEISRKIGNISWLQLGFSGAIVLGIYMFHSTLKEVILVQLVTMLLLLVGVSVPFLRNARNSVISTDVSAAPPENLVRLRRVDENEVIAEFLKSEFYQSEFDRYRERFDRMVEHPNVSDPRENTIRRALLYLRRDRLWRELPEDTEWWEVELHESDIKRLRVFSGGQWGGLAEGNFFLVDILDRIRERVESENKNEFLEKLRSLSCGLEHGEDHSAVLLIGVDDSGPLTIIEGNHRMAAATLVDPTAFHRTFRFLCGLSPRMTECCWYQTDLSSLWKYFKNYWTHLFENQHEVIAQAMQSGMVPGAVNTKAA